MSRPTPEFLNVKITDLAANDYNPQEMAKDKYKGLVSHIRSRGFTDPIKIRVRDPEKDRKDEIQTPYIIVDGEHRLRAFMEVYPDASEITCVIMKNENGDPLTRAEAIVSTVAYNYQHGEENQIKMATALKLALDEGLMIEDIEELTGMKRNRIENYMTFDNLPEPSLNPDDDFSGASPLTGAPDRKDPVIVSFAIMPEDRAIVDKAISKARNKLPPEVDIDMEKGACLVIALQGYLAMKEPNLQVSEEVAGEQVTES